MAGGVKTSIQLTDGMTAGLQRMAEMIGQVRSGFEGMKSAAEASAPTNKIRDATSQLKSQTSAIDAAKQSATEEAAALGDVADSAKEAAENTDTFKDKLDQSAESARKVKGALQDMASCFGLLKKGLDFVTGAFDAYNQQQHSELQLKTTLANMGAQADAFDQIAAHAKEIQKAGIYGDESMLAGAAEFATYMSDPEAITSMMDTLADYAMGMSGGGELSQEDMVNYATNIGKICTGAYDAMTKKGFEFTEAQKAVIDGTATEAQYVEVLGEDYKDMSDDMKAATAINQVIADSWKGLYATMSNTPEGKVIALKNAWSDFKEMIGAQVAPAVGELAELGMGFVDFLATNLPIIQPLIVGITAAIIGLAVAKGIYAAATWIATGAAQAFFAALLANPFTWIAVGIGIVVMLLYKWIQSVGGLRIAWEICKTAVIRAWEQMQIGFHRAAYGIMSYASHMGANVLSTVEAMVNGVIALINMLISALNKLPGVSIQAISQVSFGAMAQAKAAAFDAAAESAIANEQKQSDMNFKKSAMAIKKMQMQGDSGSTDLIGGGGGASLASTMDDIAANTGGGGGSPAGQTAGNTGKMADQLDVLDDILEYMGDIAERETVNRFTTAEINIEQTNNNAINSSMDLDGIMEKWNADFTEILEVAAEGVHV